MSGVDGIKGLHDVTILASNVPELREFYGRLGLQQVVDRGDELAVFLVGTNELAIHTSTACSEKAIGISIVIGDLEPIIQKVKEMGIAYDGPQPLRPGMSGIGFFDPNGNRLEFLQPG